jgi:hypothetical protein
VLHADQRLVERCHDARLAQYVERAARALDGLFAPQHVAPARRDEHELVEVHDLHGARHGAHVAGVARLNQDEAGLHGDVGPERAGAQGTAPLGG